MQGTQFVASHFATHVFLDCLKYFYPIFVNNERICDFVSIWTRYHLIYIVRVSVFEKSQFETILKGTKSEIPKYFGAKNNHVNFDSTNIPWDTYACNYVESLNSITNSCKFPLVV